MQTINFYNEIKNVYGIKTFNDLKQQISILYFLDPVDVDELIFRYRDEEQDVITINSENDFQLALQLNKALTIELEISEKSRLFMTGLEKKQSQGQKTASPSEILKQEIAAKEAELKALMEKEAEAAAEEKRIQEEASRKKAEEDNKNKIFRNCLKSILTSAMTENMSFIKECLITETVNMALDRVEKMMKGVTFESCDCSVKESNDCLITDNKS